jgi:hypothetical protein
MTDNAILRCTSGLGSGSLDRHHDITTSRHHDTTTNVSRRQFTSGDPVHNVVDALAR